MRLIEVKVRLESPAIISSKRTKEGYVRPLRYLPGSTLRGAVISSLYVEGLLNEEDLKREAKNPSILASPAYPIIDGFKSYPATPFVGKCKLCGKIYDLTEENVRNIMEGKDPVFHGECEKCQVPIESLYDKLISKRGEVEVGVFRLTSVGIDKKRGVSAKGMLFDYEAIEEGIEFWARLRVPREIEIDGLEIFIGRGASRGFGRAIIEFVGEYEVEVNGNIFYALSDLTPLRSIRTLYGVTIKIREVYGRNKQLQTGWDMEKSKPRPVINVVGSGAVVVAEVEYFKPEISAVGIPLEVEDFWITGLNVLTPISEYLAARRE